MKNWKSVFLGGISGGALLMQQQSEGAVTVYGEATSTGPTINVNVYADIVNDALMSFGVNLSYSPTDLYVLSARKNTNVWYMAASGVQYDYADPDTSVAGQVRILGGRLDGSNPLQGVTGTNVLLGTVSFGRLTHNTPTFSLALAHATDFANFVTTNGNVLDSGSGSATLTAVSPDPNDTKLVGIPDWWQLQYFGSIGTIWWSDDPDGDGFNNLQEYEADTNPTNRASFLGMSGASRSGPNVTVSWHGGVQATQVLQRSFSLGSSTLWVNIFTNLPPTLINASYVDVLGGSQSAYYRVMAHR
ncbi:MAG TPA: hypothetical protein VL970_04820 [Candidatus Acidoferrales bacterium]|nr:hypothetical protein [Candidatus Acidoferrales bacterium]